MKAWLDHRGQRGLNSSELDSFHSAPQISALSLLRNPPIERPINFRNRFRRVLILTSLLAILAAGPLIVVYDLAPREGLGSLILVIHDRIYLPLRGWLWTSEFPWNLTVWIPVLVVLALLTIDWAVGISPLRLAQDFLIKKCWGMPIGRRVLDLWHRGAGNGAFRAQYLERVLETEASGFSDRILDTWLDPNSSNPLTGRVAQLILWGRVATRYETLDQLFTFQCRLLIALAVYRHQTRRSDSGSDPETEVELRELELESRELLKSMPASRSSSGDEDPPPPLACLALLRSESAVWAAECAIDALTHGSNEGAILRDHIAKVRECRVSLAVLAANLERGRDTERLFANSIRQSSWGASALALYMTAMIAAATADSALKDEVAGLLNEFERLRFASMSLLSEPLRAAELPEHIKELLTTYEVAARRIDLGRMRAVLDSGTFRVGPNRKSLDESLTGGDDIASRGNAGVRGDLWATSGFDGERP